MGPYIYIYTYKYYEPEVDTYWAQDMQSNEHAFLSRPGDTFPAKGRDPTHSWARMDPVWARMIQAMNDTRFEPT